MSINELVLSFQLYQDYEVRWMRTCARMGARWSFTSRRGLAQ